MWLQKIKVKFYSILHLYPLIFLSFKIDCWAKILASAYHYNSVMYLLLSDYWCINNRKKIHNNFPILSQTAYYCTPAWASLPLIFPSLPYCQVTSMIAYIIYRKYGFIILGVYNPYHKLLHLGMCWLRPAENLSIVFRFIAHLEDTEARVYIGPDLNFSHIKEKKSEQTHTEFLSSYHCH